MNPNAIRRIFTFLLIIPLGMIVYIFLFPNWQWEHPDLEFPFLIIGVPILVLNFFLWVHPEFFQPFFHIYENPVQISNGKSGALLNLTGVFTALILVGVGAVSVISKASAPPVLETPAAKVIEVADFPAFGGSPFKKTAATGSSPLRPGSSEASVASTPAQASAVAQIPISGGESTSTPASSAAPTKAASPTIKPTNTTTIPDDCAPATSAYLEVIREGIFDSDFNYTVKTGWAVESNAAEDLLFVAAKIYGDDIDSRGTLPGVWGMYTYSDGYIEIYAINDVAQDYSYTLWGEDSDPDLSMQSDGAQDAYDCALSGN